MPYQSTKGHWKTSFGGVGRNIAEVAKRLGTPTTFITALGSDQHSSQIRSNIKKLNIDLFSVDLEKDSELKGPLFLSVLDDKKDSVISVSNMDINHSLTAEKVQSVLEKSGINNKDLVVVDANVEPNNKNLRKLLEYLNN